WRLHHHPPSSSSMAHGVEPALSCSLAHGIPHLSAVPGTHRTLLAMTPTAFAARWHGC
uniref:Uncharacterized protein n=1 Tax=Pavo cristatus TaxID=9049 RepID=A0A8C9FK01_PAVCR